MEASSPMSPSSSLRHRLRMMVCCCFGSGAASGERQSGREKLRWRRRVATGEFGYDPLSYALNFDERGDDDDVDASAAAAFRYKNFSSQLPSSPVALARRSTAIAIA
ncbi:hypothetical protein E2562_017735 [Oryza meyeriana var. granulata]|uniref:Uncharacterized protein n=1 Tax=Oryza meyeriana var. granulata TaxID=110450 RepID=A0A6G1BY07_9ORYZ|nr:hypothetical protein E2562_017735 [Oryza meyeriana var. granulata]